MDKKSQQLNMPFGTAANRLKKLLLFALAGELGRLTCFHCNEPIESVEVFSIEHKVPWLDNNADLFWDLENIAFSHISCNCSNIRRKTLACSDGHRQSGETRSIESITGLSWCSGCRQQLEVASFNKNRATRRGLDNYCRSCRKKKRQS